MTETCISPESAQRKKIEIVQVMRGIAALGIVYFHTEYGPWKSSNWGVDFFFILSGYFLMWSTEVISSGGGLLEKQTN